MKKSKIKRIFIVLFIISIICAIYLSFANKASLIYDESLDSDKHTLSQNVAKLEISQRFKADKSKCIGARVKINSSNYKHGGRIKCELYSRDNSVIAKGYTDISKIKNDDFNEIIFDNPASLKIGEEYKISFRAKLDSAKTKVFYYISPDKSSHNIGSVKLSGAIVCEIINNQFSLLSFIFYIILFVFIDICILYLLVRYNNNSPSSRKRRAI